MGFKAFEILKKTKKVLQSNLTVSGFVMNEAREFVGPRLKVRGENRFGVLND